MAATAVVWGNCQAEPMADLLTAPLAAAGIEVVPVPPVFLATEAELAAVHEAVRGARVLISQPVSEEYPLPNSGTEYLASLLPSNGRLVTFPNAFHLGPFPCLVHARDGSDTRVDAPMTDYHDLRAIVAASKGLSADEAVAWWPTPDTAGVRAQSDASLAELRRRESSLDVGCSPLMDSPSAQWTVDHPTNAVLAAEARAVLAVLDLADDALVVPERQYLAQRQAPLEPAVVEALDWPAGAARPDWVIDKRTVPLAELLEVQLAWYRERPDVVSRTLERESGRLGKLGLAGAST